MWGPSILKGIKASPAPTLSNPPLFLANGFNPTLNQSEHGIPQISRFGSQLRRVAYLLVGHQTFLPGPFHFADQVGVVQMGTYSTAPTIDVNHGFRGSVPLSKSPVYKRPEPWRR